MKRTILLMTICLICVVSVVAQTQKKPAPGNGKPAPSVKPFKNASDSFSYAIGLSISNFYKQQGIKNINTQMVLKALNDAKNNKPLLNEMQANTCIMNYMQTARSAGASGAKKTGAAFLEANKKKEGVVTLPSGLQYLIVQQGTGPKPTINDTVKCHYTGSFIDGKVFESSYTSGQPVEFPVGRVIAGWTEALQLMPVGSKWKLFIPSELGYGDNGNNTIPAGSTLVFDVELLEIVNKH